MAGLVQDLRYGLRILWKSRIYTFVSVLTLLLGIGASTAIFSVVYGVLLRPLPYHNPEQIVRIWEADSRGRRMQFADPNLEDMHAQVRSLQSMAGMRSAESTIAVGNTPERVRVAQVSADFFSVLGVQPLLGRSFAPEDQRVGAGPTALVSYSFWQRYLHQSRDLSTVRFNVSNSPVTIIGVLPPGFHFPEDSHVWMPRELEGRLPSRTAHNWQVVARIRDGVSLDQARADATVVARRISEEYQLDEKNMAGVIMLPLKDAVTRDVKPALLVLLGIAGLLLLVACANVMNLSLAQTSARADELAVRVAMGASRWRLLRQFLAETLLLCLVGGGLGVIAAYFGVRALLAAAPPEIPRLEEVSVSLPVLGFALGVSFLVAAGLAVLKAWRATSGQVRTALAEAGTRQGTGARSRRAGRMIVVGQVAITLTLLTGAGLLGRSMLYVLSTDPGFETEHIVTLDLKLPDLKEGTEARRVQFLEQLISGIKRIPGVQSVGGTNVLPLKNPDSADGTFVVVNRNQLTSAQRELLERSVKDSNDSDKAFINELTKFMDDLFLNKEQTGYADYVVASEGYFEALRIPLLNGRLFNNSDGPSAVHAAVISEAVARQKWPGQNPIGQTIEFGNMDGDLRLLTVVGVVAEVRKHSLESAPRPTIYVNYRQRPRATQEFDIVVRTNNSDPAVITASVRSLLTQLDPTVPPRMNTFSRVFSESLHNRRFNLLLVGVFALAALLLATTGVFGVLAYSVAQRTSEIGVRIALGATRGRILTMVLGQGLLTVVIGLAIGLAGSLLLTRTMSSMLFEVTPNDPVTMVAVTLLVALIAMLASVIPARRATRVDPMITLRR
jgi:ABC-type antimicrobial peptide transport system permease subunit